MVIVVCIRCKLCGAMVFQVFDIGQRGVGDLQVVGCEVLGCSEQNTLIANGMSSIH